MKNRLTLFLSLALVLFVTLGCGLSRFVGSDDSVTTKDSSSKSADSDSKTEETEKPPSGEEIKLGIKECDELATYINDNSEEIEGSLIARGIVYMYKNVILGKLKESVEKMNDEEKGKMGEACAKSFEQLKKSLNK